MNEQTNIFKIPECNLAELTRRITHLIKKATKLGATPIIFNVGSAFDVPLYLDGNRETPWFEDVYGPIPVEKLQGYTKYYPVTVEGEAPKLNGWAFAATLQRIELEEGGSEGILRTVSGIEIPTEFRSRFGQCDHCKADRQRNDVYVVRNIERGEFKVVGSTCLKDFLGHPDPLSYARIAEYMAEIGELCGGAEDEDYFGGGGSRISSYPVIDMLSVAAAAIRLDGYYSKTKARERDELFRATASMVQEYFTVTKMSSHYHEIKAKYAPTEEDRQMAETAREWARELGAREEANEYQYTISVLARSAGIELRNFGYATSIISSYQREVAAKQEGRISFTASEHIGKEGEKLRLTVTLVSANQISGESYGYRRETTTLKTVINYAVMREDGQGANKVTWFATGDPGTEMTEVGKEYQIIATVKKHGAYQGVRQTIITRVTLDKGQKITEKKPKSLGKDANKERLFKGDQVTTEVPWMALNAGYFRILYDYELEKHEGKYEMRTLKATVIKQGSDKVNLWLEYIGPEGRKQTLYWLAAKVVKVKAETPLDSPAEAA